MHNEFPIEQTARHAGHRFQSGFARQALRLLRSSDVVGFEATAEGLVIRAQNELSLSRPTEILRDIYGEHLSLSPPRVRYVLMHGRWHEPVMVLRVRFLPRYLASVRDDLVARRVALLEEYRRSGVCVLRAEAPLRDILGYGEHFSRLTEGTGFHWTWLDRYRPLQDPPDGRAA